MTEAQVEVSDNKSLLVLPRKKNKELSFIDNIYFVAFIVDKTLLDEIIGHP